MRTKFINPAGRVNEAELSEEQVAKLEKTEGYTILRENKKPRIHISDSACIACEG